MTITDTSTIVVNEGLLCCDLADGAVVLNAESGVYYGLDPVGTFVWSLIQKPIKVHEILAPILKEYEVDYEKCLGDVRSLLTEMATLGLIDIRQCDQLED
jgi:hypothetical protein